MRFRLLLTAAFFVSYTSAVLAQQPPASQTTPGTQGIPQTITLDEAIREAIARNYTIRTSGNNADIDQIEVHQAKDNMWLPTASATASYGYDYSLASAASRQYYVPALINAPITDTSGKIIGYTPSYTTNPAYGAPVATTPAGSQNLSYSVGARENLFNGFGDIARVHQAEANLGAGQNNFTWTRQEIADQVVNDYVTLLRNNELVFAADSTLAEANAQLALVQGQYEAGVVAIAAVYTQQSVVGQDSLALIQARVNYANSKVALLFLLNVPPDQFDSYSFNASGIDTATDAQSLARVDTTIRPDSINAAIDRRPDILAQEQTIKAAEYQIDVTRAALYPSLDATIGIAGSGDNPNLGQIPMNNSFDAGLSLTIPIFDAMQTRLEIDVNEVQEANARIMLEQDVQQVRNSVAMDVNNLKAAEEALSASDYALKAALESFRLAEEQLRVGAGTEVDVIIAEAALETARTNRVNAKYNWVLAQEQMAYDLGQWNY